MLSIGVSGHRHLADREAVSRAVDRVFAALRSGYGVESIELVSPLAEGADRIVAWRAWAAFPTRLVAPLPLEVSDYRADFGSEESQHEFSTLLARADRVVRLPPVESRERAYLAAGLFVLDHCDVLIAIWDGQPNRRVGGTAEIVAEARRRRIPLAWIQVQREASPLPVEGSGPARRLPVVYEFFPDGFRSDPGQVEAG